MRSSLISANTSNEGERNRQVGGFFILGRLSMWVPISGRKVGLPDNDNVECRLCGINSVNVVYPPLSQIGEHLCDTLVSQFSDGRST
jgi:hypothetical protein